MERFGQQMIARETNFRGWMSTEEDEKNPAQDAGVPGRRFRVPRWSGPAWVSALRDSSAFRRIWTAHLVSSLGTGVTGLDTYAA